MWHVRSRRALPVNFCYFLWTFPPSDEFFSMHEYCTNTWNCRAQTNTSAYNNGEGGRRRERKKRECEPTERRSSPPCDARKAKEGPLHLAESRRQGNKGLMNYSTENAKNCLCDRDLMRFNIMCISLHGLVLCHLQLCRIRHILLEALWIWRTDSGI